MCGRCWLRSRTCRRRCLAERVGWTGSIRWFSENVKRLRPEHRPVDPSDRIVWAAGDAAQCDLWFPPRKIPLEDGTTKLLPVLVIAAAHSRFITLYGAFLLALLLARRGRVGNHSKVVERLVLLGHHCVRRRLEGLRLERVTHGRGAASPVPDAGARSDTATGDP